MKPIVLRAPPRELRLPQRRDVAAADDDPAAGRRVDAGDQVQERRLARARGPISATYSPSGDVEVDAHQDRDLDLVPAVDLLDVVDANQRLRPCSVLLSFDPHLVAVLELDVRTAASEISRSPALEALRHFDLALHVAARRHRREHRPAVDDAEDAGLAVHRASARPSGHDARARLLALRRLRRERDPRREVRQHAVVGVEERDLDAHGRLLPVGGRHDLAQPAVVDLVRHGVERDLGRLVLARASRGSPR